MKAYLSFNGFSRMIDIPQPLPMIMIPVLEVIDLYVPEEPDKDSIIPILVFHRNGELSGGEEVILKYSWDGKFPRSKK